VCVCVCACVCVRVCVCVYIRELYSRSFNTQGQAAEVLPCDVLLPQELPSKIQGMQGEIIHISLKEKLLDSGVALREM